MAETKSSAIFFIQFFSIILSDFSSNFFSTIFCPKTHTSIYNGRLELVYIKKRKFKACSNGAWAETMLT